MSEFRQLVNAMTTEYSSTTLSWTITAESENSTDNSTTGISFPDQEMIPLWVPYVILTIFLLILVLISFVRFHRVRVAQNRERLEAVADQLEKEQQAATLLAARKNGAVVGESQVSCVHPVASDFSCPMSSITTPSSSYVPAGYLDLFLSFSQTTPVCIRVELLLIHLKLHN